MTDKVQADVPSEYANEEFWTAYAAYVVEAYPRHKAAVDKLCPNMDLGRVLDLGCGKVMEGVRFVDYPSMHYVGVDQAAPMVHKLTRVIQADYRTDMARIRQTCENWQFYPDTVLSLFSIEPTADAFINEGLYRVIFKRWPTVQRILVAGFYYEDKEDQLIVQEAGGLKSYQTLGPLMRDPTIHEYRLLERGPSALFGQNVIEVWRLLNRVEKE